MSEIEPRDWSESYQKGNVAPPFLIGPQRLIIIRLLSHHEPRHYDLRSCDLSPLVPET